MGFGMGDFGGGFGLFFLVFGWLCFGWLFWWVLGRFLDFLCSFLSLVLQRLFFEFYPFIFSIFSLFSFFICQRQIGDFLRQRRKVLEQFLFYIFYFSSRFLRLHHAKGG